ncbi:hypothetical protein [Paenibacillus urinalis]|uniref:hypothetical protein n=1 Tax=Paenibacillus urinalis TaxID=521520 RepID=UPI00196200E7
MERVVYLTNRIVYLEMAKMAKERGKLSKTLLTVYERNMARAYKREKAAEAPAATSVTYKKNYSYYSTERWSLCKISVTDTSQNTSVAIT